MDALIAGIAAIGVSLACCLVALRVGPLLGFVDSPDGFLKNHAKAVVPLGGICIWVGMLVGLALGGALDGWFVSATGLLLIVGLIDDRRGLSPLSRLVAAAIAGVILSATEAITPGFEAMPGRLIFVVAVIVMVNAVNLIDGIDGLAGSLVLLSCLGLAAMGSPGPGVISGLAIAGFLVFNLPPARMFLGDNGSYLLGAVLVWLAGVSASDPGWGFLVALAAGGIIVIDLTLTLIRRYRGRRPLFTGDRSHLYDQLVDRGFSVRRVTGVLAITQLGWLALVWLVSMSIDERLAALTLIGLGVAVLAVLGRMGFLRIDSLPRGAEG